MPINSAMSNGVTGLNSFANALEITSDNVANTGTTAFKANSARFGDMVTSGYNSHSKDGDRRGAGSVIIGIATDYSQGPMVSSSSWSDIAMSGEGFFSVSLIDNQGNLVNANQTYYTRDGSFVPDRNGYLINSQGYAVLNTNGDPIFVDDPTNPAYTDYYVDSSGQIWGRPIAGGDPVEIPDAQIRVSLFPNPQWLQRKGGNLYATGPESRDPIHGTANDGLRGAISSYNVEGSNVDLAKEMVNMIIYQSSYSANTKSITTGRDMLDASINLVR